MQVNEGDRAQVVASYSESGGVGKTTLALSLGVCSALRGHPTYLLDLDPRAALTKWMGVEPIEPGLHMGAILADANPEGWVSDLAVPCPWSQVDGALWIVPGARNVSNREADHQDYADVRLKLALAGLDPRAKVVVDMPNRQGGPLVGNALEAATDVLYACVPTDDGLDGVEGARTSVARFLTHRAQLGAPAGLREAGIVLGRWEDNVTSLDARRAEKELRAAYGDLVMTPYVPQRVIVRESRAAGVYYGWYGDKGKAVHDAMDAIAGKVLR
jgi:cellulose biosynthesis protein BcsQ